jgi:hypothetical protein
MRRAPFHSPRLAAALILLPALAGCSDASIGLLGTGATERVEVYVDGPLSSLGSWRYYDGVRLLECDVLITATAEGGSSDARAEWVDGVVDLFDLQTGRYLASDYLYASEMGYVWGAPDLVNGERRTSRALRYTSYGPFRAYFLFRYESGGVTRETEHRFDCR